MAINIAIDGPAGAGKSTIAKAVARELNSYMWIQGQCTELWLCI